MLGEFSSSPRLPDSFRCPRCNRDVPRCGAIECPAQTYAVFRCDQCLMTTTLDGDGVGSGEPVELPFTFTVDETGRASG